MSGFWSRSSRYAVVGLFAVYFPVAGWLQVSYVPSPPQDRENRVVWLVRPFPKIGPSGFAFVSAPSVPNDVADEPDAPQQSPMILYEDGRPLGPPHSAHADISKFGLGRFSHWKNAGFIFSSSDNSNPNYNGRNYWIARSKK
jgi:hypothetical protein